MPAQTPGRGAATPWSNPVVALALATAARTPGAAPAPGTPTPLSRRERRAARRAPQRPAPGGAARAGGPGVTGTLARGAVAAVTAGLLVGGDLAPTRAAGYGGVSGTIVASPAVRAVNAQVARLEAQADADARASREESVALAAAALRGATAVRPLLSQAGTGSVPAELGAAVERLAALLDAARPTHRMRADVPLPPARPAAGMSVVAPAVPPVASAVADAGAAAGGTTEAEAAPEPEPLIELPVLPDPAPLTPIDDADVPGDDPDAQAGPEDAGEQSAADGASTASDPAALGEPTVPTQAASVDPLAPSEPAAPGTPPAATDAAAPDAAAPAVTPEVPGDPVSPADPAGTPPAADAVVVDGPLPTGPALTAALAAAAGAVFQLSMQVESLASAARHDEALARVESLAALDSVTVSAGEVVSGIEELEPLAELTEEERLALAAAEAAANPPAVAAGSRPARLRSGTPAGVTALIDRWQNGAIPAEELCAVPFAREHRLQCDAAEALAELNVAYRAAFGTDLDMVSSYRTYEVQVSLRATKGGLAAVPGTSNHGWGIAVDLGGIGGLGDFTKPGYLWLKQHAGEFGWVHPRGMEPGGSGPQEPWHWEFGTA